MHGHWLKNIGSSLRTVHQKTSPVGAGSSLLRHHRFYITVSTTYATSWITCGGLPFDSDWRFKRKIYYVKVKLNSRSAIACVCARARVLFHSEKAENLLTLCCMELFFYNKLLSWICKYFVCYKLHSKYFFLRQFIT